MREGVDGASEEGGGDGMRKGDEGKGRGQGEGEREAKRGGVGTEERRE